MLYRSSWGFALAGAIVAIGIALWHLFWAGLIGLAILGSLQDRGFGAELFPALGYALPALV